MDSKRQHEFEQLDPIVKIILIGTGVSYICSAAFIVSGSLYNILNELFGLYGALPTDVLLLYPIVICSTMTFIAYNIVNA